MKRKIVLLTLLCCCYFNSYSQEWFTDFDAVKKIASQENKSIILVFQGSDWCAPCIKLEKKIWLSDAFKNNYKKHFVLLKADFPRRKKNALSKEQEEKNKMLAESYNKNGHFPFVLILNPKGSVLGTIGYTKDKPKEYFQKLVSFTK